MMGLKKGLKVKNSINLQENINRIKQVMGISEDTEVSNYQSTINNFKRILPNEYSDRVDVVFNHIKDFIEEEGFVIKVLNNCFTSFKGVRTKNYIILCSPSTYNSLADLVYIMFHEIRHEIQMNKLKKINPLSGDIENFDELYEIYWEMEMDAHDYGIEWVKKVGDMVNLPEKYYTLTPMVTQYPTMSKAVKSHLEYVNKEINDLKRKGYDYDDLGDLPMIKNLVDKLEDLF